MISQDTRFGHAPICSKKVWRVKN